MADFYSRTITRVSGKTDEITAQSPTSSYTQQVSHGQLIHLVQAQFAAENKLGLKADLIREKRPANDAAFEAPPVIQKRSNNQ